MRTAYRLIFLLLLGLIGSSPSTLNAQQADTELQSQVKELKKQVLTLNRNLFILEEDLLFPTNIQFNVFLSMNTEQLFAIDSVELKIDDKVVTSHLYTPHEMDALKRGGVQRLYQGSLASGEHEIIARFVGRGPNEQDYQRGKTVIVDKGSDPLFVELQIVDDPTLELPSFEARTWE